MSLHQTMNAQISYGKTLLTVDHVSLSYDGRPILRDVCAEIRDNVGVGTVRGQVVGFLGPSGIGKTQLFRIMAGLLQPTSGAVRINDGRQPTHPGEVGVVAQSYPLFAHRTVRSNLELAANGKRERIAGYLEEFGLADRAHLYPAQLSGGQRQRVAMIQQVLCSDHFLLMDEPFSGLDLINCEKACAVIQKLSAMDTLNTIILVTHDITSAASVADHLWMMGRERDAAGEPIPGARIVQTYDLIERNLCWEPGIVTRPEFTDFVREVKARFRTL